MEGTVIRQYKYSTDRPILVCGVQRSGTSMVAGVLFKLGVFMGEKFIKRNKLSPRGYFEDLEFGENDTLLYRKDINKNQWIENVKRIVKKRQENPVYPFTRWGWKSPAAPLNIEDYIKIADPQIIWCQREKQANMKSLNRMFCNLIDEKTKEAVNTEKIYTERMAKYKTIKDRSLTIQMENLLSNPSYEIGRLVGYLGLEADPTKAIDHIVLDGHGEEPYTNYL